MPLRTPAPSALRADSRPSLTPDMPGRLRPLALAGAALIAALTAACSGSKAPEQSGPPPAMPVTVLEAQPQQLPAVIELMAQTEGAKETEVRARVGGILIKRLYQEGALVKAGQPLFQIDPVPYQIALADATAKAEQTAREEARLKGLLAQQAVSRKEYDDATSNNAVAQAALRQAQLNLSWTTVTAPVSGVSGRAAKSEGNLIAAGEGGLLTSVYQSNPMWVSFGLSESDSAKLPGGVLKPGMVSGVELILPDGSTYTQTGKINFLASTIDTTLGTQQLRAEFPNPDGRLLPGQFVRVRLLSGMRNNVYLVPQAAVVQTEQGNLVMVADANNKVTPHPVQTAEWRGKDWVVTGGLQPGDKVIVDNLMKLRPGAAVLPHPPQAPGAPGAPGAAPAGKDTPPAKDAAPAKEAASKDAAAEKPAAGDKAAPSAPAAQPAATPPAKG
ncbi:efflux RND transporter periplasmic adaptor subunit [Rhodocyclus tenuis]|uniref:Efflux RND transporter periplasmic adaptor subunit n=2 Tax=Rhodocyclus TaxID=1064 RepID=A0A6L5JYJ4_RHOTE|nr:efflux RND transporter periplasmic adaptor subunit [Rhodocyclus gracilis]MQY52136.1 efflux RND transporter periplasmic adaptor subunit [Rhodocyclus gracilis]MRD72434.1 efflux RND transporter periplasmic adaptor subunit [Rhodocyclus gracilis]NJA89480.1 efflux RND transporter periplasmic adaptor subunit [Rhodocyclus gracilis]